MSEFTNIPKQNKLHTIVTLRNEITKNLNLPNLYSKLIRVLYQDKQYKEALLEAQKAIDMGINSIKMVKLYSKLLIISEEYEKVVEYLEGFLEKEFDYDILSILSNAYFQISRLHYFSELKENNLTETTMRGRVGNYWMESKLQPEDTPVPFSQLNVSQISATKARMLYVLKDNQRKINTVPALTQKLDFRHPIKQVSCGLHFYMVLDSIGRVFVWGNENSCHIGFNTNTLQLKSISAGYEHCAAISVDDQLYTWGRSSFGKLGLGFTSDVNFNTPTLVVGLSKKSILKVSCFGMNTSVLTRDGKVFVFGRNHRYQIGAENAECPELNPSPNKVHRNPTPKPTITIEPPSLYTDMNRKYNTEEFSDLKISVSNSETLSLHICLLSLTKDITEFFCQEIIEKPTDQPFLKYEVFDFLAKIHHATHKEYFKLSESKAIINTMGINRGSIIKIFQYFYGFQTEPNFYKSNELQGIFNLPDLENGIPPKPFNLLGAMVKVPEISDCKIKTKEGKTIYTHKLLLSRSNYFKNIFASGFKESQTSEVVINERYEVVSSFTNYLYLDRFPLPKDCTGDDLLTVLDMSNLYQLTRLTNLLEHLISISLDLENAIPLLNFAKDRNANQLVAYIANFICTNKSFFEKEELMKLPGNIYTQVTAFNIDPNQVQVGGQYNPKQVLSDYFITDIAQGEKLTIALDKDNNIHQLGYGSNKKSKVPISTFKLNSKITKMAVGSSHATVLTEAGELYGWGCGFLGQLGQKKNFYATPTILSGHNKTFDSISTGTWSTFSWLGSQTTLLNQTPDNEKNITCPFFKENQLKNIDPWVALSQDETADVTVHVYQGTSSNNDNELVKMLTNIVISDHSSDGKSESSVTSSTNTSTNSNNNNNSFEVLKVHSSILPILYQKQFKKSPTKPILIFGFSLIVVKKLFEYQYTKTILVDGSDFLNLLLLTQISGSYASRQLMTYIREVCSPSLAIQLLNTLSSTSNIIRLPYLSKFLISYLSIHKSEATKLDEFYTLPSEMLSQI